MVRLTGNFLNFQYENYITSGADTSDPHLRTATPYQQHGGLVFVKCCPENRAYPA
jgi:hypothetical protein